MARTVTCIINEKPPAASDSDDPGSPPSSHSRKLREPLIQVEGLTKRYRKASVDAISDVTFEVREGEFFALLGPNGAGKTTTISILTTTLLPTGGRVRIGGFDVANRPSRVREQVGIVFQQPSLDLNLTAEENVRLHAILYGLFPWRPTYRSMPAEYRQRLGELSEILGLKAEIFKPVKRFSGGMRRKLEIVRSLMHRPRALFLDEPTAGLDADSRRNLWTYLAEIRRSAGTTVLLTTHYLEEAEEADRICLIADGRVIALGSPAELKQDLSEDYLVVTCDDYRVLERELDGLGVDYQRGEEFRIFVRAGTTVHSLLRSVRTPLSSVRTHFPTLEDAYLRIVAERNASG